MTDAIWSWLKTFGLGVLAAIVAFGVYWHRQREAGKRRLVERERALENASGANREVVLEAGARREAYEAQAQAHDEARERSLKLLNEQPDSAKEFVRRWREG